MKFPNWAEYVQQTAAREKSNTIGHAAMLGMWPFRCKDVIVADDFDIDYNQFRLTVEWRIEGYVFPFQVKYDRDELMFGEEAELLRIANKVFQYYRFEIPTIPMYIEDTPTHPHIILGEN